MTTLTKTTLPFAAVALLAATNASFAAVTITTADGNGADAAVIDGAPTTTYNGDFLQAQDFFRSGVATRNLLMTNICLMGSRLLFRETRFQKYVIDEY